MINWLDKTRFQINDTNFRCYDWVFGSQESTTEEYFLQKDASMVRVHEALVAQLQPQHVFELGIWQGGSCVFFDVLTNPQKLVAIELSEQRISALDSYIARHGRADKLVPYYGVDQADRKTINAILQEEFGSQELDLIIDDASHFVDETRVSFNLLFPKLRAGGVYVIEDWSWGHDPVDDPSGAVNLYPEREPLSRLVFEIVLATASTRGLIDSVDIDRNLVKITRGDTPIHDQDFDIAQCCLDRGRRMLADHIADNATKT